MKTLLTCLLLAFASSTAAAADEPDTNAATAISIEKIISSVSHKTNRKFVVDPRVNARVTLVGQEPSQVTYNELLTILEVHGYVTFESEGYVVVIPDANSRQVAQPMLTKGQTYADAQVVNYTIKVQNGPAASLVPILRPLLPQYAQLAAWPCANALLITDRYANVKRIEAIVKALDVGTPYNPEKCEGPSAAKRSDS
jgi:general secretion pathway protein D